MATIKQLVETKQIPEDHWLTKANITHEDVEIDFGTVLWRDGVWCGGAWRGGTWLNGTWLNGTWHVGTWLNGTWLNGTWRGGVWRGGTWRRGFWHDGASSPTRCKHQITLDSSGLITIGCETRTIEQWDEFFSSDEIIETQRGTEAFWLIEKAYHAARASALFERQNPAPKS